MHRYTDHAFLDRLIAGEEEKLRTQVKSYLSANYKPEVLDWCDDCDWALKQVPLADIASARRPGGHNPDKVNAIAEKLKTGNVGMPVVLVKNPDGSHAIADGYHRIRAFEKVGRKTIKAYVASGNVSGFKLSDQHAAKTNVAPGEKADQLHPQSTEVGKPPYTYTTQRPGTTLGVPEAPAGPPSSKHKMATVTIKPSDRKIRVRVLDTAAKRAQGYKGVDNTPDPGNAGQDAADAFDGLLFDWGQPQGQSAMHNAGVSIPVSCTWFDEGGLYADHAHLLASDSTPKRTFKRHQQALEVPTRDWNALGLGPGSSISVEHDKDQSKNGSVQLGPGGDGGTVG